MRNQLNIMRVLALFGLCVSSASLVDTVLVNPAFCDLRDGCGEVTSSIYGKFLGVPLAAIGLMGFGLIFTLALFPRSRGGTFLLPLAIVAGLTGITLIVIQWAVLKKTCALCLLADSCGIGLMIVGLARPGRSRMREHSISWTRRLVWLGIALLFVSAPIVWALLRTIPPLPPGEVKAHWIEGRITVVELTDFECHHCARADQILQAVLKENPDVHFVRLPVVMPIHPNARPAARAYLAARQQGKGEEMAALLYGADIRAGDDCRRLALSLGLKMDVYERAVNDPATDAELDATVAWARRGGRGVPQIWVQDHLIPYVPTADELRAALQRAVPFGRINP